MKHFPYFVVLFPILSLAAAVKAQPFTLNSAVWHAEVQGQPDVDRTTFTYSASRNGVGDLYGTTYSDVYRNFNGPPYDREPGIRIANTINYATGWSGPAQSRSFLLRGTIEWTVDRVLTRPLVIGFGERTGSFFPASGALDLTIADSQGNTLFHEMGIAVGEAGFVETLLPGTYTTSFSAAGSVTLGETMGHLRNGGMLFEMWLVAPAPGSSLAFVFVFIYCARRCRAGCQA